MTSNPFSQTAELRVLHAVAVTRVCGVAWDCTSASWSRRLKYKRMVAFSSHTNARRIHEYEKSYACLLLVMNVLLPTEIVVAE